MDHHLVGAFGIRTGRRASEGPSPARLGRRGAKDAPSHQSDRPHPPSGRDGAFASLAPAPRGRNTVVTDSSDYKGASAHRGASPPRPPPKPRRIERHGTELSGDGSTARQIPRMRMSIHRANFCRPWFSASGVISVPMGRSGTGLVGMPDADFGERPFQDVR